MFITINRRSDMNVTSDMLLPDYRLFLKENNQMVEQQPCEWDASPIKGDLSGSPYALIPSSKNPVHVKLPKHRIFLKLNKTREGLKFQEIKGTVNVPDCSSWYTLQSMYMKPGAIIEVDVRYIKETDKYAREGDIDKSFISNGSYFYAAQLCLYRGSTMTTVGYFERPSSDPESSIQPILRNINYLPPLWQQMEQECQRIYRERQSKGETIHPGITVLKFASTVDKYLKHLVQTQPQPWWNGKKKPFNKHKGGSNGKAHG